MRNIPEIRMGLIAVSRDCFPIELSQRRRRQVANECEQKKIDIVELHTIIENERDVDKALQEIADKQINALTVYLGNFGPEGPTTLLMQKFAGPVMVMAAAEESANDLIQGRGDAYCGLLSAMYNVGLRRLRPYLPAKPVADAATVAECIADFKIIARIVNGVRQLKIISFGPRPFDFMTCHAPIQPLFDLGVEIMENSELDLYDLVKSYEGDERIRQRTVEMAEELGKGNTYPELLPKLAQYEIALEDYAEQHLGMQKYVAFANKCWPAFEKYFGHVPCYVNSRLAAKGIPVACEADIYGALSEYMAICATDLPPAILDINNTVPADMYEECRQQIGDYKPDDLWMGFHCGNVSGSCLVQPIIQYQLIMHRLMEPGEEPDITRGTLEGQIKAGPISIFRLQSSSEAQLSAYMAEGEVLPINPRSFGSIGVFAIKEMGRFYRYVLLEKRFPHHTAVAFKHSGKFLWAACKMLGVDEIFFNLPKTNYYPSESPFE